MINTKAIDFIFGKLGFLVFFLKIALLVVLLPFALLVYILNGIRRI